jgi:hypothetical protein
VCRSRVPGEQRPRTGAAHGAILRR